MSKMVLLGGLFDWIFSPLTHTLPPQWSLIIISFIITLLTTLSYKYLTNQTEMKLLKEDLTRLKGDMKKHRDSPEKISTVNKELMEKNLKYMRHSMRPMLFTFIPIIIIFSWLRATFLPTGDLFSWGFRLWPWGTGIGWLWTYLLSSIIFSTLMRKLFKIH